MRWLGPPRTVRGWRRVMWAMVALGAYVVSVGAWQGDWFGVVIGGAAALAGVGAAAGGAWNEQRLHDALARLERLREGGEP